jgi:hypothetical protein
MYNAKDLEFLSRQKEFARFIHNVAQAKDIALRAMYKATTENIQQVSGAIIAYDSILDEVDAKALCYWAEQDE